VVEDDFAEEGGGEEDEEEERRGGVVTVFDGYHHRSIFAFQFLSSHGHGLCLLVRRIFTLSNGSNSAPYRAGFYFSRGMKFGKSLLRIQQPKVVEYEANAKVAALKYFVNFIVLIVVVGILIVTNGFVVDEAPFGALSFTAPGSFEVDTQGAYCATPSSLVDMCTVLTPTEALLEGEWRHHTDQITNYFIQ
jgi:hypothetical protein